MLLTHLLTTVASSVLARSTVGRAKEQKAIRNNAQNELKTVLSNDPLLSQLSLDDTINQAYLMGYITKEDKTKYLNLLKDFDENHKLFETGVGDFFNGKTTKEIERLYGVLTKVAPEIGDILNNYVGVDVKSTILANTPELASAPGYTPEDVNFTNNFENREAEPLKWWGGKELAEHHDLKWDLDTMYDAVKQGTSANVVRDKYTSDQMRNAALRDDHEKEVAYLSDLRNTKSDAITSGATAGARAANEILGMLGTGSEYAQSMADVANNRWNTVQQSLLDDAYAEVTANNNYINLGKNIFDNIEYLYANDVERRGAELEQYANMYAADEALRGARMEANASMFADQVAANAYINQQRQGINDANNQYAWMWDRFHGRAQEQGYTGNLANAMANRDFFNWALSQGLQSSAGLTNYRDWRTQTDK